MGVPVIPLVLLGVGVLVLRSRKRPRRKADETSDEPAAEPMTMVYLPPATPHLPTTHDPTRDPGDPCEGEGGSGAWDDDGNCKVFWVDGVTDDAIRALAREEWQARGAPGFKEMCAAVKDPLGGEFAPPKDNPMFEEIAVTVLRRYYEVGPGLFPPKQPLQSTDPTSY
ncbi:MAG: hypothetical protein K0V04_20865 [Deltaproteobacteria bacterium]|nr:hypothetical protein [Deltaproteobacteria bacterium]